MQGTPASRGFRPGRAPAAWPATDYFSPGSPKTARRPARVEQKSTARTFRSLPADLDCIKNLLFCEIFWLLTVAQLPEITCFGALGPLGGFFRGSVHPTSLPSGRSGLALEARRLLARKRSGGQQASRGGGEPRGGVFPSKSPCALGLIYVENSCANPGRRNARISTFDVLAGSSSTQEDRAKRESRVKNFFFQPVLADASLLKYFPSSRQMQTRPRITPLSFWSKEQVFSVFCIGREQISRARVLCWAGEKAGVSVPGRKTGAGQRLGCG